MGSSESKPGPEGPKGDKGDKGDKGNPLIEIEVQKAAEQEMKKQTTRIAKEAALDARIEQEVQAARDAEAARRAEAIRNEQAAEAAKVARITNILNQLLGGDSNKTLQQKNNNLRIVINEKMYNINTYLHYYLRWNPSVSDSTLIFEGNTWIQENTINIPLDKTDMVENKWNIFNQYITNSIPQSEKNIILNYKSTVNQLNNNLFIVNYIVNNETLTEDQINLYLKDYLLSLATETQGFTNYSRGTDYSNISVDNGSYSFKQKLTGSPISF